MITAAKALACRRRHQCGVEDGSDPFTPAIEWAAHLLDGYPSLKREDIHAAMRYAADTLAHEEVVFIDNGSPERRDLPVPFLADESCDFTVVKALRNAGHDITAIAEISPALMMWSSSPLPVLKLEYFSRKTRTSVCLRTQVDARPLESS